MTKRRAYFLLSIVLAAVCALTVFVYQNADLRKILPAQTTQPGFYRVVEVYDGDTIAVNMGTSIEKIRMIGVDTPETHKPGAPVQCFGPQASDFTKNLLNGQAVRLEADPTNSNRDRYDRLLRYVYTQDGTLVDQKLIELGYGFAYLSFPFQKADSFAASQQQAQNQSLGLWAACQTKENSGRWQSNNL